MGNLLWRYWMPFATVSQLEEHPTRTVRLLGEHLVAYKDRSGRYGLMQEYCRDCRVGQIHPLHKAWNHRGRWHAWLSQV